VKSLKLSIKDDRLSAYISLSESKSHYPSVSDILGYLKSRGIVFGILTDHLEAICQNKETVISALIARGEAPRGRLSWKTNIDHSNRPVILPDDRVDFKKLVPLPFVTEGTPLVVLAAKEQVKSGRDIYGVAIRAPKEADKLPRYDDKTIEKRENTLFSKQTGYLSWNNNILSISKIFHVEGDVDYGTGNLKVNGAVVIKGDVRSGFRVEADGPITIKGTVDAATIYSQAGDILIGQGIMGQGRARVMCGGNLICGFAQDAQIAAKKNITFESYAINCTISSGGSVKLSGKNSVLRGGSVTAESGIETANAGSERGVETELILRSSSGNEKQAEIWKIARARMDAKERRVFLQKRQSFLNLLKRNNARLSEEKMQEGKDIQHELHRIADKLTGLKKTETELSNAAGREIVKKEVIVRDTLYHNVRIDIGGKTYTNDMPISRVSLVKIKNEIVVEMLDRKYNVFVPRG